MAIQAALSSHHIPLAIPALSSSQKGIVPAHISSAIQHPFQMPFESKHFMYGLINTHVRLENSVGLQAAILDADVKRDLDEMGRLEEEKMAKFLDLAQANASKKKWSIFSNAAQYAVSASAIALSISSASKGLKTCASIMLLASGILGLSNRVLHDTGAYKALASWITKSQELQEKLAMNMEMGMFCLSFGLGLSGGLWSYKAGAIAMGVKVRALASKLHMGAGLGKVGIEFHKSLIQKQSDHMSAAMQRLTSNIMQLYQKIHASCKDTEKSLASLGSLGEELKEAIRSLRSKN